MIKIKKKEGRRWMRNEDREEGFLRGIVILPNLYCEEVGFGLAHFVALILITKFKSKDRKDGIHRTKNMAESHLQRVLPMEVTSSKLEGKGRKMIWRDAG